MEHRGITRRGPCPFAVLRAAQPCSDREGPPDLHALRVRSPYEYFKITQKDGFYPSFALWWSIGGSNLPKTVKSLQFRERSKTPSPLVFKIVFKHTFYECSFYLLKISKNQKIFKR